jgi:hypothetical protein
VGVCGFAGVTFGFVAGCVDVTARVDAGVVCVFEEPSLKSITLAPRPRRARRPTAARIRSCGLRLMLTAQLTVQVPGVKSEPTDTPPPGPCWTATQRPTVAVRQKSVALPVKPAGFRM